MCTNMEKKGWGSWTTSWRGESWDLDWSSVFLGCVTQRKTGAPAITRADVVTLSRKILAGSHQVGCKFLLVPLSLWLALLHCSYFNWHQFEMLIFFFLEHALKFTSESWDYFFFSLQRPKEKKEFIFSWNKRISLYHFYYLSFIIIFVIIYLFDGCAPIQWCHFSSGRGCLSVGLRWDWSWFGSWECWCQQRRHATNPGTLRRDVCVSELPLSPLGIVLKCCTWDWHAG